MRTYNMIFENSNEFSIASAFLSEISGQVLYSGTKVVYEIRGRDVQSVVSDFDKEKISLPENMAFSVIEGLARKLTLNKIWGNHN